MLKRLILTGAVTAGLAATAPAGDPPPAVRPHLPLKQAKGVGEFRVGEGHWVYITAQISQVGTTARIEGELTAKNRTTFAGFVGTGIVSLYDDRDNIFFRAVLPARGVNGTWLGGSNGTRLIAIDLPADVAARVRRFTVKAYQGDDRGFLRQVAEIAEEAKKRADKIRASK